MSNYFTTVGLHDGNLEMEIVVGSIATTEEEAREIGNSKNFHIGILYKDRLMLKKDDLVIRKDETEKYQFRVCRVDKLMTSSEDYDDITWDEAVAYLVDEQHQHLPFPLESYYFGVSDIAPFKQKDGKLITT